MHDYKREGGDIFAGEPRLRIRITTRIYSRRHRAGKGIKALKCGWIGLVTVIVMMVKNRKEPWNPIHTYKNTYCMNSILRCPASESQSELAFWWLQTSHRQDLQAALISSHRYSWPCFCSRSFSPWRLWPSGWREDATEVDQTWANRRLVRYGWSKSGNTSVSETCAWSCQLRHPL